MTGQTPKHTTDSDRLHLPRASNARFVVAEEDKKKAAIKEGIGGTYGIGGTFKSPQKIAPSLDSLASPSSTDTDKMNQTRLWTVEVSLLCALCWLPTNCFPLLSFFFVTCFIGGSNAPSDDRGE